MTQPDATPARCDAPSMRAARWMMAGGARFGHSHGGQVSRAELRRSAPRFATEPQVDKRAWAMRCGGPGIVGHILHQLVARQTRNTGVHRARPAHATSGGGQRCTNASKGGGPAHRGESSCSLQDRRWREENWQAGPAGKVTCCGGVVAHSVRQTLLQSVLIRHGCTSTTRRPHWPTMTFYKFDQSSGTRGYERADCVRPR